MKLSKSTKVKVSRSKFNGVDYIDVRVWVRTAAGEVMPTKKGISIPEDRFEEFQEMIAGIDVDELESPDEAETSKPRRAVKVKQPPEDEDDEEEAPAQRRPPKVKAEAVRNPKPKPSRATEDDDAEDAAVVKYCAAPSAGAAMKKHGKIFTSLAKAKATGAKFISRISGNNVKPAFKLEPDGDYSPVK